MNFKLLSALVLILVVSQISAHWQSGGGGGSGSGSNSGSGSSEGGHHRKHHGGSGSNSGSGSGSSERGHHWRRHGGSGSNSGSSEGSASHEHHGHGGQHDHHCKDECPQHNNWNRSWSGNHHKHEFNATELAQHLQQFIGFLRAIAVNDPACNQSGEARAWNVLPSRWREIILNKAGLGCSNLTYAQLNASVIDQITNSVGHHLQNFSSLAYSIAANNSDVLNVSVCISVANLQSTVDSYVNGILQSIVSGDYTGVEKILWHVRKWERRWERHHHHHHHHHHGGRHGRRHEGHRHHSDENGSASAEDTTAADADTTANEETTYPGF